MRQMFGFHDLLSSNMILIPLGIICFFVPLSAAGLIMMIYTTLQVMSLSQSAGVMLFLMFMLSYIFSNAYQARQLTHFVGVTVLYRMHIPYLAPLWAGLFGNISEVTTIICGSVISFYLKTVHDSVPQIADAPDTVNALDLVQSMVSNPMFFVYELAIVGMFVMVWLFRSSKLKHSWVWAVIFGTLTEFVIMLGGSLFLNDSRGLTQITVGSLVTLIVGILLFFVFQDLDFKRVETVQFSDDEYYYYVTAVPRIRLAEEDKEIKKITGSGEDSEAEEEKEVEE
ncbi:MAG: hypothetical protein VZR32_06310 [Candidatus Weimeria sp.]|nr:hypothetical protein [Lachnospiraceae bacterium]MEE3355941.1 hypothetical protein [Candidatus Weimeria sp.]